MSKYKNDWLGALDNFYMNNYYFYIRKLKLTYLE